MDSADTSILQPVGYQNHSCGYCSPPGQRSPTASSHSVGVDALRLTCADYQSMLDRGWRRSGTYCYKPDMRRTCCPQYTIRLDALTTTPTKKQRKVVSRWTRYVLDGDNEHTVHGSEKNEVDVEMNGSATKSNPKSAGASPKKQPPFDLIEAMHAPEYAFYSKYTEVEAPRHKFEVTLEPSSYTDEKFALYKLYQTIVHKETKEHVPSSFERFLVESPLQVSPIPYESDSDLPAHLPRTFGSYHQLYRLDGQLIAMAVLDILPSCVSSVYFMYDSTWERFSLGKLSALREASLAREIHAAGARTVQYLYMGYYIQSCQKMRYKGDYSPSFLLDPEAYTWHPLAECVPLLEHPGSRYACFAHPDRSLGEKSVPSEPMPEDISEEDARQISLFNNRLGIVPLSTTNYRKMKYIRDTVLFAIDGLGMELSKRVILTL